MRFKQIIQLAWSFAERTVPRLASAVLLLALAFFVTPSVVGLYSWAILGVTLFQALTDVAIRQIAVHATVSSSGNQFLRRYRVYASVSGTVFVLGLLLVLWFTQSTDIRDNVWLLLPLAFAPIATNIGIISIARLQMANEWKFLASGQLIAAIVSLAVTLPVMALTQSVLASAIQLPLTELLFSLLSNLRARKVKAEVSTNAPDRQFFRDYLGMSAYSALGWGQGQADRLLVGTISGTANLGYYSTATSISRSLGDAMAAATANVLRTRLPNTLGSDVSLTKQIVQRTLLPATVLAGAGVLAVWCLNEFLLRQLLSSAWQPALSAVPILAVSAISSVATWSLTTVLVVQGKSFRGLPIRVGAVLLGIPIALATLVSLEFAGYMVVARDILVMISMAALVRRWIPWMTIVLSIGTTAALTAAAYILF